MRLHPLYEEDGQGGGDFTPEQAKELKKSYDKLQSEFTKVTQKNSEYSKEMEKVKPWVEFDKHLETLDPSVRQGVADNMDKIYNDLKAGKVPTATAMKKLDDQIDGAESKKIKAELEELRETVIEREYEKIIGNFEKAASKEGFEFKQKDFESFAHDWLKDLGVEDDFTDNQLKKAYEAYETKKVKELNGKGKIPPLSTSGAAAAITRTEPTKVGGLKGAGQRVMEKLRI